jgi:hypothetical protein
MTSFWPALSISRIAAHRAFPHEETLILSLAICQEPEAGRR